MQCAVIYYSMTKALYSFSKPFNYYTTKHKKVKPGSRKVFKETMMGL